MKLDALDHPKTYDFASRLDVTRPTAIGHLELLWSFTGQKAPQGNLGKWPDGAIARACDWMGDPKVFISALVDSGFLDVDEQHRLTVHDWSVHAPGWVRAKLKNAKLGFLEALNPSSEPPRESSRDPTREPTRDPTIQVKGSEGKGSEVKGSHARALPEPTDTFALLTRLQAIYPAGTYTGVTWHQAERELGKLLDAGESAEVIVANTTAYRDQQQAAGKVGTQFIRSPKSFFGEGHWRGPFPLPTAGAPGIGRKSVTDTLAELRAAAGE